jgi:hypothetical protein
MNRAARKRASKPNEPVDLSTLYKEIRELKRLLKKEPPHSIIKAGISRDIPGEKMKSITPAKIRYQTTNGQGASTLIVISVPANFELEAPFTRIEVVEGEIVYYHKS